MRAEISALRGAAERAAEQLKAENALLRGEILKVADQIMASGAGAPPPAEAPAARRAGKPRPARGLTTPAE
jgi:hypothetical protein